MNNAKQTKRRRFGGQITFTILAALLLNACQDDGDNTVEPIVTVQFVEPSKSITENSGETIVSLVLDKPASETGFVSFSVAGNIDRYNTFPVAIGGIIKLPVTKGQSNASFTFVALNNLKVDGSSTVDFTITETSDGLLVGATKSLAITVTDDDIGQQANFLLNAGSIRENKGEGLDLVIVLNGFTKTTGKLTVKLESGNATYGTDFTTVPAAVNGQIELNIDIDTDYTHFTMVPVNNNLTVGDRVVHYTIQEATGGVVVGPGNKLDITIYDDEAYPVATVADIRAMFQGEILILPNTLVTAVITSVSDNVDPHWVVIEDPTGGLVVKLIFTNDFKRGDQILFNMGYGYMKETNGVLEVSQISEADKIGEVDLPYQVTTLEELSSSTKDNEGKLVWIDGVTFPDADNSSVMKGDHTITDGTNSIKVRTLNNASFANEIIPTGNLTVKGILTEVNGAFILYPQVFAEDVISNAGFN